MRCLLVGAGAVGQVYGRHLALGGADVAFLVRPRHAGAARQGFDLYPLGREGNGAEGRRRPPHQDPLPAREREKSGEPTRFAGFGVLASVEEVAAERWDPVLLCVSSTALREGDGSWLAGLARACGDATVVGLQPGIEDPAYVGRFVAPHRLAWGTIGVVSYAAPLPGEERPRPGVAYWFPPLMKTALAGPAAGALVEAFGRGGLAATLVPDAARATAFGDAALTPLVAALECAGWVLRELRSGDLLAVAHAAIRDAFAIAARVHGVRAPFGRHLLRPWVLGLLTRVAPRLTPFDLETYLCAHFRKVGEQTRLQLRTYLGLAARHGLPAPGMRALAERLVA